MNISHIVLSTRAQIGGYIIFFIDPISSVANSRFLLALRETSAKLSDTGSTVASSVVFRSHTTSSASKPPGFVASLSGPDHIEFPKDDSDLDIRRNGGCT